MTKSHLIMQTYEAIYQSGVIRLTDSVQLPEHTRVYVIVPDAGDKSAFHLRSPRLLDRGKSSDFVKEVIEEGYDAPVR